MSWEYGQNTLICPCLCRQSKIKKNIVKAWIFKKFEKCCLCLWWQHESWLPHWTKGSAQHPAGSSSPPSHSEIVPCKKSRTSQKQGNALDSSSFLHWTYYLLKIWHWDDHAPSVHRETLIPEFPGASMQTWYLVLQGICSTEIYLPRTSLQLSFACTHVLCIIYLLVDNGSMYV